MTHRAIWITLACAALVSAACAERRAPSFEETAASMEGIYRVALHTESSEACEPGGSSLGAPDQEGYVVVKRVPVQGLPSLSLLSCAGLADCRAKIDRHQQLEPYGAELSITVRQLRSDGSLEGAGATTGFGVGGTCTEGGTYTTLVRLEGTILEISQRHTEADDYPVDADGFCTTELAREAAAGKSCSRLEQLSARFVAPL